MSASKPSNLNKNKRVSVRVNEYILNLIKKEGLSVQKIFDKEIDRKFKLEIKKDIK